MGLGFIVIVRDWGCLSIVFVPKTVIVIVRDWDWDCCYSKGLGLGLDWFCLSIVFVPKTVIVIVRDWDW